MAKLGILFVTMLFVSCDKGYRIRFANYYTERMDTVLIAGELYYQNVKPQEVTEYSKLGKGTHAVRCVSSKGKIFQTSVHIPGSGTGDRTVQVDAINQVSVLEN